MTIVGFDTETHLMIEGNLTPKIVCCSMSTTAADGEPTAFLQSSGDPAGLLTMVQQIVNDPNILAVAHNAAFDLNILRANYPDMTPAIFEAVASGKIACTKVREKLLNLTEHGKLDVIHNPDGSTAKVGYSLSDLVLKYLGLNIAEGKNESDAWRTNYINLDGKPVSQWPKDAIEYAVDDAVYCLKIYHLQEERRQRIIAAVGHDPFVTEAFRTAVDFALFILSARGAAVDKGEIVKVQGMIEEELGGDALNHIIEAGILVPATPPAPHANGAQDHLPNCAKAKDKKKKCKCPPKMTKGTKASISMNTLRDFVVNLKTEIPEIELKMTPKSDQFPEGQISVDDDWMKQYAHLSPVLMQYQHRQKLQKIVTTELPRMMRKINNDGTPVPADVVHPNYDVLKETGRTSSFAGKIYPSFNCQNVDPRVRNCYVARPGTIMFSVDYAAMELGTAAQEMIRLFGHSVLAQTMNQGIDPHAYLGAQLALALDPAFTEWAQESNRTGSAQDVYALFQSLNGCGEPEAEKLFKHYRKFAKPTGLGYPGGLGPKTFIAYARGTFDVSVDMDTAKRLREIWLETFPEFKEYFAWLKKDAIDPHHVWTLDKKEAEEKNREEGDEIGLYCYTTPMGMYRPACGYCPAANGKALQSPSAEGALLGLFNVVRACYDPSQGSILYGKCWPQFFIHDEIVGEIAADAEGDILLVHDRVQEIRRLMKEAMEVITPDVRAGTSAALMLRWDKRAEPRFDEDGKLTIWEPETVTV